MQAGTYINDGTAVFIVRDTRDGTPVGRPVTDDVLRDSYVKRNGALLQRSSYPTLIKFLQDNPTLVTSEANWPNAKHLWTWGDGNSETGTTIRVPDDRGLYEQLSDSAGLVAAGLPNVNAIITKFVGGSFNNNFNNTQTHGALSFSNRTSSGFCSYTNGGYLDSQTLTLDASKSSAIYGNSDTVTPPSVRRIVQMKY